MSTLHTYRKRGKDVAIWHDNLALLRHDFSLPDPPPSLAAFVADWASLTREQKEIRAADLLTPQFLLDDMVRHTRLCPGSRAAALLTEHRAELKDSVALSRVIDNGTVSNVATGFGAGGVFKFLMMILKHTSTKGYRAARVMKYYNKLNEFRAERCKLVPQTIVEVDCLVSLHLINKMLKTYVALCASSPLSIP